MYSYTLSNVHFLGRIHKFYEKQIGTYKNAIFTG